MLPRQRVVISELRRLENEIYTLGWDTQAAELGDLTDRLNYEFKRLEKFHEVHPKNSKGQFISKGE